MSQEIFPIYISNVPEGNDDLKGLAHEKIANEIGNVIHIQNKNIQRQVIGLEGDWGSGKSNIIKKLENDLNHEKYLHFIFDTWGHQEDLNRRAILEELIDFLSEKKECISFRSEEWKKRDSELKGKTIESKKTYSPEIKFYWLFFISSITFYHFSKEYIEYDILPFNCFNIKYYLMIWVPIILFFYGIFELKKEWNKLKLENSKKEEAKKSSNIQIISKLLYFIKGEDVESSTTDFIIENEPSNKKFRYFLDFINESLISENKILILTIDNIDRLAKDKIKALWSTINIFFADKNDNKHYNNIWLIVPYDESKILSAFVENDTDEKTKHDIGVGLIDKTFSVKFRVTPPIPSNWEILFEKKLNLAFGNDIIPSEEVDYIKRIFDGYTKEIITPRQIINFVNDLVTIYSINKEIRFRYLSLFILAKKQIVSEPISQILSNDYLIENVKMIFNDDTELQKNISAITFGVTGEMAEEIVYSKEIRNILNSGNEVELEKFKNNPIAFRNNFFREFNKLNLDNLSLYSLEKIPVILNKIKKLSLIDIFQLNETYWKNLKKFALNMSNTNPHNLKLNSFHKELCYYNIEFGKEILEKSIECMHSHMNNSETEREFIDKLKVIDDFLIEKTTIKVSDIKFKSINKRILEPENTIYLVEQFPDDFHKFNLKISELKLTEYYLNSDKTLNIELLNEDINDVIIIKETISYKFENLIKQLKLEINNLNSTNIVNLDKYLKCLKSLSNEKPIKDISIPINLINQYISKYKTENEDIHIALICFTFFHLPSINSYGIINNIFTTPESVDIKKVSAEIEYFIDYDKILNLYCNDGYNQNLIKEVAIEITKKSYGVSRLNISWIIEKYSFVLTRVFDNDKKLCDAFYNRIIAWTTYVREYLNKSPIAIIKIDLSIIDYALSINNDLSTILLSKSNEYLNTLNEAKILSIIENNNTFENNLFKKLNSKNKVDDTFIRNKLHLQLLIYLDDFASGKSNVETSNFSNIRELFSTIESLKQKDFYKKIVAKLNHNDELAPSQVSFFINGIIEADLLSKTNNIFLKHFINFSRFDYYFTTLKMHKKIIDIVSKAKDNELKTLIWDKVKKKHNVNGQKDYASKKGFKPK